MFPLNQNNCMPSNSLLRTKQKKLWLPNLLLEKKNINRSPQNSKPVQVWLKADFVDSTIFAYDYRARLSIRQDFRPAIRAQFSLTTNVVRLIYTTRSVVKSWRILIAHDSRKQKLRRLNRSRHCLYFIYARKIYVRKHVKITQQWKSTFR